MRDVVWAISGAGEPSLAALKSALSNGQPDCRFLYEQVMGLPRARYKSDGVTVDDYNGKTDGFPWWDDFAADGVLMDGLVSVAKYTGANITQKVDNYYANYVYFNLRDHMAQVFSGNKSAVYLQAQGTYDLIFSLYTGLVVLDIEAIQPWYNQSFINANEPSNKMWKAYQNSLGITNESVIEENYNAIAKLLYTKLINDIKGLLTNPARKLSVFNTPIRGTQYQSGNPTEWTEMQRSSHLDPGTGVTGGGGWLYPLLDFLCPLSWVEDRPFTAGEFVDRTAAGLSNSGLQLYFDLINGRKAVGAEAQFLSNKHSIPVYWFNAPTYDNGKYAGQAIDLLGWRVARSLWDQTPTNSKLIVWTPLTGDSAQYFATRAGLQNLLTEALTMPSTWNDNSTFPNSLTYNASQYATTWARVEAGGIFVHVVTTGDSMKTIATSSLGTGDMVERNKYAAQIWGPSTVTEFLGFGSFYTNAGSLGGLRLNVRCNDYVGSGFIEGGVVKANTAYPGFLPLSCALPGFPWRSSGNFNLINIMPLQNGECAPPGSNAFGGTYFDWQSGQGSTPTIKFEALICGWTGSIAQDALSPGNPPVAVTGPAETTWEGYEGSNVRNVNNADAWNSNAGTTYRNLTGTTATGVAGLANKQPAIVTLASFSTTATNKYPLLHLYRGASAVLPIGAFRARHPTLPAKGVVVTNNGVGGEHLGTFFDPNTGLCLESGPVYAVLAADAVTNNNGVFILVFAAYTNRLFAPGTAADCLNDTLNAAAVTLQPLTSAQRRNTIVVLEAPPPRISSGSDSASFTQYNMIVGALCEAAQQISVTYGVPVKVLNMPKMMAAIGNNTLSEEELSSTADWSSATTYALNAVIKTAGRDGYDFWRSQRNSNLNIVPGNLSDPTAWRKVASYRRGVNTTERVHGSLTRDQEMARIFWDELRAGALWTSSGSGTSMTTSQAKIVDSSTRLSRLAR